MKEPVWTRLARWIKQASCRHQWFIGPNTLHCLKCGRCHLEATNGSGK